MIRAHGRVTGIPIAAAQANAKYLIVTRYWEHLWDVLPAFQMARWSLLNVGPKDKVFRVYRLSPPGE